MAGPDLKNRLQGIASAFAGREDLGFTGVRDLEGLVLGELGSLDVFEGWLRPDGGRLKAVRPDRIYHVLASNLAVSAETSLLLGLILGSELIFKLPGAGLPGFEATVEKLPAEFRERVRLTRNFAEAEMAACDALVVYGSDETVNFFRSRAALTQRSLFYGHRISFGILAEGVGELGLWAGRAAEEVSAYDQGGCLSPQFYWMENKGEAAQFADLLAEALRTIAEGNSSRDLAFEETAQRRHARRLLRGRGAKVWEGDTGAGYTVALLAEADFSVGPGHRFIQVGFGGRVTEVFQQWKGQISSISLATPSWPSVEKRWEDLASSLGASRLCCMGNLQKPPLSWRHDGRPRLADLVQWISWDA